MKKTYLVGLLFCCFFSNCVSWAAQISNPQKINQYFQSIQTDPIKLSAFLQQMPKGGDLHNHFSGAAYAEDLIQHGSEPTFCLDRRTFEVTVSTAVCPDISLDTIKNFPLLYQQVVRAWSMQDFQSESESGHDHFFATFPKFKSIIKQKRELVLAEILHRAGKQGLSYIELMITPGDKAVLELSKKLGWHDDFNIMRERLLSNGLEPILSNINEEFASFERNARQKLLCDTANADVGCQVKVKFIAQAGREQPLEQVFAQLLTGFETAKRNHQFVGVTIVQPEDSAIALRDYQKHMSMFNFLHTLYPTVNISLHAGELSTTLVKPEELTFHIQEAIKVGQAKRIGHGTSITYENNADSVLNEMAQRRIFVEINLTSNKVILGTSGQHHPLPLYLRYGVPVALSTDDEGVLRSDLTHEYMTAARDYGLSYQTLKQLVRNSVTYSFLMGESLWQNEAQAQPVSVCNRGGNTVFEFVSDACKSFLQKNEKAQMQWQVEKQLAEFEKRILNIIK